MYPEVSIPEQHIQCHYDEERLQSHPATVIKINVYMAYLNGIFNEFLYHSSVYKYYLSSTCNNADSFYSVHIWSGKVEWTDV